MLAYFGYPHKVGEIVERLASRDIHTSKRWIKHHARLNFNPVSLLDVESSMLNVRRSNRSVPLYVGSLYFFRVLGLQQPNLYHISSIVFKIYLS